MRVSVVVWVVCIACVCVGGGGVCCARVGGWVCVRASMCVRVACVYACVCACGRVYVHVRIRMRVYLRVHACMHVNVRVRLYMCV